MSLISDISDLFYTYDSTNVNHKAAITYLQSILASLPPEEVSELTTLWRQGKSGGAAVTVPNLVRYFNRDKEHHMAAINKLETLLEIYSTEDEYLYFMELWAGKITPNEPLEPSPDLPRVSGTDSSGESTSRAPVNDTKLSTPSPVNHGTEKTPPPPKDSLDTGTFTLPEFEKLVYKHIKQNYENLLQAGAKLIVYIEGLSSVQNNGQKLDYIIDNQATLFKVNNEQPNQFNDLRCVFDVEPEFKLLGAWEATTKPGKHYTEKPMRPEGAFKIARGLHERKWQVGYHLGRQDHLALVQTGGAVTGYRDLNKDFTYDSKDQQYTGYFGINQHHGWNVPSTDIQNTSAGCLVGRTILGHKQFMDIIQKDARYLANRNFAFSTLVLRHEQLH